jgi:teichuronic acid biosynthesis glycosyltransferase TuaG
MNMPNQNTLVSIVTAAFNAQVTIGETIQSVQKQSYINWEMLIVLDEGTKDSTEKIILEHQKNDPRIRLLKVPKGRGLALSRNYGLDRLKGRYLCFLDADDLWLPNKLASQLKFMSQQKVNFSCAGYRCMSQDGKLLAKRAFYPPRSQNYFDLLGNNQIPCLTAMLDLQQVPAPRFKEYTQEDFIFWLEVLKTGVICHGIQEELAQYRVVQGSRTQQTKHLRNRIFVYRHLNGLSFFETFYYLSKYVLTATWKRLMFR